ncbi:lengsin [Lepisosteus oculatus]|uniref:lengsin n=1 Tax=Lepisosteus oculatus TaxID=7918 RepID=UPI0035F50F32
MFNVGLTFLFGVTKILEGKGMDEIEDSNSKGTLEKNTDELDGSGISFGKRKGVRVSGKYLSPMDWERGASSPASELPSARRQQPTAPPGALAPPLQEASFQDEGRAGAVRADCKLSDDWRGEEGRTGTPCSDPGISKQTLEELKNLLRESSLLSARGKEIGKQGSAYSYLCAIKPGGRLKEGPVRPFTTFKPHSEGSQRTPKPAEGLPQPKSNHDTPDSSRPEASSSKPVDSRHPANNSGMKTDNSVGNMTETDNIKDPNMETNGYQSALHFTAGIEHIKQQIAREEISFVRFEATDLHGVSRSKTVPARFFQEKAIYGVSMPRSYLELTLSPKDNEVDHISAASFNGDVLLIPDLPTFRILPWSDRTARVICDSCALNGNPLSTSPRHVAKQLLNQLRAMGLSLHSSFTYECCIFGFPEKINSKTLFFPAATLLSNHDLPFFQQLIDGMYFMGADVESFASASGPGQMEISFQPEFGISAADSAFTFRTGIKEMAKRHGFIASFFTNDGFYNSGIFSHSLWDVNGKRNLLQAGGAELSEIGKKWLAGLLYHSAALSCLMAPGISCRHQISKDAKDPKQAVYVTWGCNDNSCAFNVKCHGGKGTRVDNKLGSATANPYLVLAGTVAAGLDGIRRNLAVDSGPNGAPAQQPPKRFAVPLKLEDALAALEEDHIIRGALGDVFVQYFIAMKRYEIETKELDAERNKYLEYFI